MRLDRTALAIALLVGVCGPALAQEVPADPPAEGAESGVAPLEEGRTQPDPMPGEELVPPNAPLAEPETEGEQPAPVAPEEDQTDDRADDQTGPATVDPTGEANYGEVDLAAGFAPDPHTLHLLSGGEMEAYALSDTAYCTGYIDVVPDYRVNYTSGDLPLYITATSTADTALVVHTPSGEYLCDDDSAGNFNPRISITEPESGSYAIWVASYGAPEYHEATLEISELTPDDSWSDYGPVGSSGTVSGEIHLATGFKPDPIHIPVRGGGDVEAYTRNASCFGYISEEPTFRIHYTAGVLPLTITSMATSDTTLMVRDASGYTHCDDDGAGNLDARVTIERTYDGPIEIWVGIYGGGTTEALLVITELE